MSEESGNRPATKNKAKKKKVRNKRHRHIGPNVRALAAGRAICPMCDWQKAEARRRAKAERAEEA